MKEEFVNFGDMSRERLGGQCQYNSRYLHGKIEGWPNFANGLRILGDPINNWHSVKIHKDDVEEFVRRVKAHWVEREKSLKKG